MAVTRYTGLAVGVKAVQAEARVDAAVTSDVPFQHATFALLEIPFTGYDGLLLLAFNVTRTHL